MSDAEDAPIINLIIFCSICGMESPFDGCDATNCTWRTELVAKAICSGGLFNVICDETNNSDDDIAVGKLNAMVTVYPDTEGSA